MKQFTRIEPTIVQEYGDKFKRVGVIKHFQTDDGLHHEFTTLGAEGYRSGGVIALTPDNKVVTSLQFRAGPERWLYELPAGGFNEGEDPQDAAMRELREETGYVSDEVKFLGTSSRGGYNNETWYYYIARNCRLAESGRELDKEEADQGIEVRVISIDEFISHAKNDEMSDPHAVLMAYDLLKAIEAGAEHVDWPPHTDVAIEAA